MKLHVGWVVVIALVAGYFFFVHYKSTGQIL